MKIMTGNMMEFHFLKERHILIRLVGLMNKLI